MREAVSPCAAGAHLAHLDRRIWLKAVLGAAGAFAAGRAAGQNPAAPTRPAPLGPVYKSAESAPPDAYLDGSPHPYYGSENPWDRRFFDKNDGSQEFYDRRAPGLILDILEGRIDAAEAHARKLLAAMPDDLEAMFVLCAASAARADPSTALIHVRNLIAKGLPIERFYAGPRPFLDALTQTPDFRALAPPPELLHGPMLGAMSDAGFSVWVRTRREAPCRLVVSQKWNLRAGGSSTAVSSPAEDFTAKIEIGGLKPSTDYFYGVSIDGAPVAPIAKARTFPSEAAANDVRIGFGGCAGYAPWNERMWDRIAADGLDLLLLLGDNVYISLPGAPNAVHDYVYYRRQSRPEFRRLIAETPIAAVWDDHDCAIDDCWLGPYRDRPAWKPAMVRHFQRQWCNGATGAPGWPGHWRKLRVGRVEVFLLDGRTYRTNPFAPTPTMLGPQQKAWLLKGLRNSTAAFKIIAAPVAWDDRAKPGTRDGWSGFPDERTEIFEHIKRERINGVLLLSSDRHRADAWVHRREGAYPLYEFASALLTHDYKHELRPEAAFSYNAKCNYGRLNFSLNDDAPSVLSEFVTIDGEAVYSKRIALKEISF